MKNTNLKIVLSLATGLGMSHFVMAQSSRPMPGANLGANTGDAPDSDPQYMEANKLGDYVELDASIKNEMYGTIDFPNAELKDIIKAISKLARKNFILDRKIENRRITILSPEPVTKQEAYNAFLSALYMNDLTVVSEGKFLKVIDTKSALQANIRVFMGDYAPNTAEVITVLYPLKFLNAEDIQRYLTDLVPRSGRIAAYPNTNTLVMTDTGFNLRRVIQIVKTIDIPGHEDQLENIPIRYASAKDVGKLIDEILAAQNGGGSSRVNRTRTQQKTRGGGTITKIVPDERTNSLVVLANGRGIKEIKDLVRQLDTTNAAGGGNIHLYYCKNAVAEELANTINGLSQGSQNKSNNSGNQTGMNNPIIPNPRLLGGSSGGDSAVRFEGNLRVTADKPTNSLVVVGSASDFAALKKILEKLDIPRRQVYVEATIMEINLDKASQFTVGMNFAVDGMPSAAGFIPTAPSLNLAQLLTSPGALTGLMAGLASNKTASFTNAAGGTTTIPNAIGFIKALVDSTQGQILHQPQILTSDNQEAEIKVTSKIATATTQQSNTNGTTLTTQTVTKEPVEISLKITPQLGEGSDLIRLKVDQTVDDYQPSSVGGQIDTTQRKAMTNVVVRDGDMVVVGGLQKNTISDRKSRIPILGDLPIIGKLFGGTDNQQKRSILFVFLTPHVINEYSDLMRITEKKIDKRLELGKVAKDPEDRLRKEAQALKAEVQENAKKPAPRSWSHRKKPDPDDAYLSEDGFEAMTDSNPSMQVPNNAPVQDLLPAYTPVPQQTAPVPPSPTTLPSLEASPAPGTMETPLPPEALTGSEG